MPVSSTGRDRRANSALVAGISPGVSALNASYTRNGDACMTRPCRSTKSYVGNSASRREPRSAVGSRATMA